MPKISQLPILTNINTGSVIPIVDNSRTQRISVGKLYEFLSGALDQTFSTEFELMQSASAITSSIEALSASLNTAITNITVGSASVSPGTVSSSNQITTLGFAKTGSNTFNGSQTISAGNSLLVNRIENTTGGNIEIAASGLLTLSGDGGGVTTNDNFESNPGGANTFKVSSGSVSITGSIYVSGTPIISGANQIANLGFATTSSVVNVNTSSLLTTASFNQYTSSLTASANINTSSLATTGSNSFNGSQTILAGNSLLVNRIENTTGGNIEIAASGLLSLSGDGGGVTTNDNFEANPGGNATFKVISGSVIVTGSIRATGTTLISSSTQIFTGYDYEIHVSQVDGNDTTGNGDLLTPVASITKALQIVSSSYLSTDRRTIIIHPGTYTESPTVTLANTYIFALGLLGANTAIAGTLTINAACRVSGIKMTNLVVNTTSPVYINNTTVDTQMTVTNTGYLETTGCSFQCPSGVTVSGASTGVVFNSSTIWGLVVNNASAVVIVRNSPQVYVATVLAGNLALSNTLLFSATNNGNAITTSAGSVVTLSNLNILIPTGLNVARVSLSGFYSIIDVVYDKPNSTLVALSGTGGPLNAIDYFQYINADKFITQGGTSNQFVKGDGSLDSIVPATTSSINTLTSSFTAFSSSINTTTASLNSFTASVIATGSNINSFTASVNGKTGSYATTGSNEFNGNQTITGSFNQGLGNTAAGENSHAEGDSTQAIGLFSHAEGLGTIAYGGRSHAEGQDTIASGSYSHAEGYQTIALADHQHVQGQFNATSSVLAAFIVGNGTDDSNRSNLIHAAGNIVEISGSLNVSGSTSISGGLNITNNGYSWSFGLDGTLTAPAGANITRVANLITTSSFNTFTSSYTTASSSFDSRITAIATTGTPAGTVSSSQQITNLGYATTSSLAGVVSSSAQITSFGFATTSSVLNVDTSSLVSTSSFNTFSSSVNTTTASLIGISNGLMTYTASLKSAGLVSSSTQITNFGFATTSSLAVVTPFLSSSAFNTFATSSNSFTASVIATGSLINTFTSSINAFTASERATGSILNTFTSSVNTFTASVIATGSLINTFTSSINAFTASERASGSIINTFTASVNTTTASLNSKTGSYATTGSNQFNGNQSITGSLVVTLVSTISGSIAANASSLTLSSGSNLYVQNNGLVEITGSLTATSITGSIAATNGVISGSSQLTTSFPLKTTGTWTVPTGASTQSFTVEANSSYTMWVNGNIPNGIITWNATATLSNTNVPAVGAQYGWYYSVGNALVLTAMPDQFTGTNGSILNTPGSYAPNTSNVFKFGITNNSGTTQTINYGYIKLS
jgi:hypothetical protein